MFHVLLLLWCYDFDVPCFATWTLQRNNALYILNATWYSRRLANVWLFHVLLLWRSDAIMLWKSSALRGIQEGCVRYAWTIFLSTMDTIESRFRTSGCLEAIWENTSKKFGPYSERRTKILAGLWRCTTKILCHTRTVRKHFICQKKSKTKPRREEQLVPTLPILPSTESAYVCNLST